MSTDAQQLTAWAAGDAAAGEALYRRHFRTVYRFFRSKTDEGAEDLLQDTFMVALRRADKYRGGSMRAFLLGIARYELLEFIRKKARRESRIDPMSESLVDLGTGPSSAARRSEREGQVRAALAALPLDQQIAIELRYWHELSMDEIGEIQEVATATVRTRLHRGRERLRASFDDQTLASVGLEALVTLNEGAPEA